MGAKSYCLTKCPYFRKCAWLGEAKPLHKMASPTPLHTFAQSPTRVLENNRAHGLSCHSHALQRRAKNPRRNMEGKTTLCLGLNLEGIATPEPQRYLHLAGYGVAIPTCESARRDGYLHQVGYGDAIPTYESARRDGYGFSELRDGYGYAESQDGPALSTWICSSPS